MASVVERVASVAAEGVVEALNCVRARNADHGFVGERAEGVVNECGYAGGIMSFSLTAKGIVRKRDCRSTIRVDGVGKAAPVVIGIVGYDAARPGALRKLAVGGVAVGRPLAVGIDLVGHAAGGLVIEPGGCIA